LAAKFQFVDQGPELENYYSQDDIVVNTTKSNGDDQRREDAPGLQKRIEPSVETELSPTIRSVLPTDASTFLSPLDLAQESILVHSPIKRRRTADEANIGLRSNSDRVSHAAYDPIRSQYRIYDFPKVFNSVSPDGFTYMPEQQHIPKVVEAEYRRLADSAAAAIPPESLLSPTIWKEEFYWPNQFTTTQCACLMRYYIENLAPWVGCLLLRPCGGD
jgi:hypothetical protein